MEPREHFFLQTFVFFRFYLRRVHFQERVIAVPNPNLILAALLFLRPGEILVPERVPA